MAYVANRYPRVRAAVAWSPEIAELARRHNDANVLVLPARFVSEEEGMEILHKWLDTAFEGGRHVRRVHNIDAGTARPGSTAARPSARPIRPPPPPSAPRSD